MLLSEWYYCLISSDRVLCSLFPQREDNRIQRTSFVFRCGQEWNRWRNEEGEDRTPRIFCRIEEGDCSCCMNFIFVIDKLFILYNDTMIRDSWDIIHPRLKYKNNDKRWFKQCNVQDKHAIVRFRQVYWGVAVTIMDYPQQELTKKECLQSNQVDNNNQTNLTSLILPNPPRIQAKRSRVYLPVCKGVIHWPAFRHRFLSNDKSVHWNQTNSPVRLRTFPVCECAILELLFWSSVFKIVYSMFFLFLCSPLKC